LIASEMAQVDDEIDWDSIDQNGMHFGSEYDLISNRTL